MRSHVVREYLDKMLNNAEKHVKDGYIYDSGRRWANWYARDVKALLSALDQSQKCPTACPCAEEAGANNL